MSRPSAMSLTTPANIRRGFERHRTLFALLSLLILVAAPVHSQITSTIEGRVTDPQGGMIAGAEVIVASHALAIERRVKSDSTGFYSIAGLPAGIYTLTVSQAGFSKKTLTEIELTLNRTLRLDTSLQLATVATEVQVSSAAPLVETAASSTGRTILPEQIQQMPLNGRNYLDLLQLVPGVAVNRQNEGDAAVPILGERGGNARFLIDGLPNSDDFNGGASSQFNQDSILEFQVLTSGYKAEFGHGSGGIINVVSVRGTNNWHGVGSFFHRNYKLDSADIKGQSDPPFLLRWDPSVQIGGPLLRDRFFMFASAERIRESRSLNFQFPPTTPTALRQFEAPFDKHSQTFDTRLRAKLDEQLGHHRFSQQFNLTNTHITDFLPLQAALNLPSTRNNIDSRHLMLGFSDTVTLGNQSNPFLLSVFGQYRGEPSTLKAAHPEAGLSSTLFNLFSSLSTNGLFGDQGQVQFGPGHTALVLNQKYGSFGVNLAKKVSHHDIKFGSEFEHLQVDGVEAANLLNQLFATIPDFGQFGPVNSGVYLLTQQGGATAADNNIRLRNNYVGPFVQDDWKVTSKFTVNVGLRWDYDSEFPATTDFSPRLGFAWAITPKTVVQGSWGLFYDHFRVGVGRDVPGFGGANVTRNRFLSYPRLFYGNPSQLSNLFAARGTGAPCLSSTLTDAQIAATGAKCTLLGSTVPLPVYGIDHLNGVVAAGHAPIPANAVVDMSSVQVLTGLTPQQFADAASVAIGQTAGFFTWDPFGHLTTQRIAALSDPVPITVDPNFKVPYTSAFHFGIQREISSNVVGYIDAYHKDINNTSGVRNTNLAFIARLPGHTKELQPGTGSRLILGYGPWYAGTYDAATVGIRKRLSHRFAVDASYNYTHESDNARNSNFVTDQQTGLGLSFASGVTGPLDSFVGIVPVVTETSTGRTNANGSFIASNGNPVPQAGKFYNGPDLESGPSDLALTHTFLLYGTVDLPWQLSISSIFRAQSGFRYSASSNNPPDVDGDGLFEGTDFTKGRNHFQAPAFVNLDLRLSKRFTFGERVKLHWYLEFFNLFNADNPAAVQTFTGQPVPFGGRLQVLPGREGQVGIRIEF